MIDPALNVAEWNFDRAKAWLRQAKIRFPNSREQRPHTTSNLFLTVVGRDLIAKLNPVSQ